MTSYTVDIFPPANSSLDSWFTLSNALVVVAQSMGFEGMEEWSVDITDMVLAKADEFIDLSPTEVRPIRLYFNSKRNANKFRSLIHSKQPMLQINKPRKLANKNWHESWKRYYKPQKIGRIQIIPAWFPRKNKNAVFIYPGAAFGAGTHPSTQLCIGILQRLPRLKGLRVLDFGAGTGILGICAKRWFASANVTSVEIEAPARQLILKNAELNKTSLMVRKTIPKDAFDLCFANVLLCVLEDYLPKLERAMLPNGMLICSGILREQESELVRAYRKKFTPLLIAQEEEWSAILFQRK